MTLVNNKHDYDVWTDDGMMGQMGETQAAVDILYPTNISDLGMFLSGFGFDRTWLGY